MLCHEKMRSLIFTFLFAALTIAKGEELAPIRILLVGDSTLAPKNGFGDEFCKRLISKVTCLNLAKNGRSSKSYKAEGSWENVKAILNKTSEAQKTYVLIEFGHNDQPGKPGRSSDLKTEFPVNLAFYVTETRNLGGIPILSTPLSRRSFKNDLLIRDLDDWAAVTKEVAMKNQVPLVDLLESSSNAVQRMGSAEADTLAVEPPGGPNKAFDHTHIGPKGANFFADLVIPLYKQAIPELAPYFLNEVK
jgi:lysophospholipase L1-like esterase